MKKRLLSAMLAVAMVATAALTGCSSGEGETSQTSGGDAAATGSQEGGQQKFDNVTLKYLNCWNGGFKNPSDTYNNEVAAAIRDKIGVTVEVEGIMMSETEKLNMEFASGDMHDIINAPFWGGDAGETQVLKKAAAEGRLLPLDDSIGNYENLKDAWKVGYVTEAFLENDLEDPSFNGSHYFIPSGIAASAENITNWAYGIFARKDIVEDTGIDPTSIKTSEDLYNFLVKVRDGGYTDVNGNAIIPASTFHNGWDLSGYTLNFHPKQLTNYIQQEDGSYTYYQLTED
ncbi:MAG TPA: extracellular solute-binding protein, partial [Candidatus Gallacutalibacter stercoravium]|nr:extracellular solute-binding protein [Candidatus Gallacutalibacter stercoravium]